MRVAIIDLGSNSIRMNNGDYDGGRDGSEYNTRSKKYEIRNYV